MERPSVICYCAAGFTAIRDNKLSAINQKEPVFNKYNSVFEEHVLNQAGSSEECDKQSLCSNEGQECSIFDPSDGDFTPKRQRTSFTKRQRTRLEEEFRRDSYIIGMKRWRLSEELEVSEKKIKIWFQNRRTKMKKQS